MDIVDNIIIHEGISNSEELELDKGDKRVTHMGREVVISTARDNSAEDSEAILRKENTEGYNEDRQSTRVTIMKQALLAETGQHYSGSVYINGNVMQHDSLIRAEKIAGPIKPGDYWYDAKAGFWGVMGHYCLGVIPPGIEEFSSPMPINCSGGNTNICVNGRELHQRDLDLLAARGLPTINNKKYIIDKEGIVLDEETNELIAHIGKLGPIIEREGRGLGMEVLIPRT